MEENTAFKEYTTSAAFNLSLSKNMIEFLVYVNEEQARAKSSTNYKEYSSFFRNSNGISNFIAPGKALERRGLIYSPNSRYPGIRHLTKAGEHVLELLKIAGLASDALAEKVRQEVA